MAVVLGEYIFLQFAHSLFTPFNGLIFVALTIHGVRQVFFS